jgi:hypothetical protein
VKRPATRSAIISPAQQDAWFVALVRTVAELGTWFRLADLEPETSTP